MTGAQRPALERSWPWLAAAACLPAALLPVSNPDLFWHLSAARRMRELGALPRQDWLSWTMAGAPWTDFEWLSQMLFGAAHAAAGPAGDWVLKAVLVAACAWRVKAWLALYDVPQELAAAGLAAWAAAMMPRADLRPDLFSVLLFVEVFRRLELWRSTGRAPSTLTTAAAFALWANLHGGFAYGLALLVLYACFGLPWRLPALAAAATLLNPWGPGIYKMLVSHAAESGGMAIWILEWGAPDPSNSWRWAELAFFPLACAAAWAAARRGRAPHLAPGLALAVLFAAGLRHARLNAYSASAAVPLALGWLAAAGRRPSRAAALAAIVVLGGWSGLLGWDLGLGRRVFEPRLVPERAAGFLEREREALGAKRLYNPWGWGGYLGWRLAGWRVFQDGRYLFHPLLLEAGEAAGAPERWQSFLDRRGVELALMENVPLMLPTTRRYPDGAEKPFSRPYYTAYMPRERWALVHFDEKALVFLRRSAADPKWLASREFRWLRPRDEAAFEDARSRGEIPEAALAAERSRLESEGARGAP